MNYQLRTGIPSIRVEMRETQAELDADLAELERKRTLSTIAQNVMDWLVSDPKTKKKLPYKSGFQARLDFEGGAEVYEDTFRMHTQLKTEMHLLKESAAIKRKNFNELKAELKEHEKKAGKKRK